MNKSGRILSVVILVFAIAATVMSFILAQRRNEFRDRSDKLASTTAAICKTMDENSSTNLKATATFIPADPATKTPDSGTLSWPEYHKGKGPDGQNAAFNDTLDKAKAMAKELQLQRDYLADQLAEIGKILSMPEDQIKLTDLKNLKELKPAARDKEAGQSIVCYAASVRARDDAMIQGYLTAATTIGNPLEEKGFRERQADADGAAAFAHQAAIDDFNTNVTNLFTRCNKYADSIVQGIESVTNSNMAWSTNKDMIKDPKEYQGALDTLATDYKKIQDQLVLFDAEKAKLEKKTQEYEAVVVALDKKTKDLQKEKEANTELSDKIAKLEKQIKDSGLNSGEFQPKANLHGKVLQINSEFQFVVLSLGRTEIREPWVLLVSRGEGKNAKLVARIQVSKSFQNHSVAEILPDIPVNAKNPIHVGDDVYLIKP